MLLFTLPKYFVWENQKQTIFVFLHYLCWGSFTKICINLHYFRWTENHNGRGQWAHKLSLAKNRKSQKKNEDSKPSTKFMKQWSNLHKNSSKVRKFARWDDHLSQKEQVLIVLAIWKASQISYDFGTHCSIVSGKSGKYQW